MKIIKFKKERDNRYTIFFDDNTKLKLYDDIIIKYNLLNNKEVDAKKLELITKDNDSLASYYKAIKYITIKMRTEKEVYIFLCKYFTKQVSNKTIEKLKSEGYFNNDLYIKSYINDQILLTNNGPNKIKDNLKKLGFEENEINNYLNSIDDEVWFLKLSKIIDKKINSNHRYGKNKIIMKLVYDLGNAGYYKWMIERTIEKYDINTDKKIIENEYKKVYNHLAKKYEGENLKYQIKMKLFQKGFTSEEISELLNLN